MFAWPRKSFDYVLNFGEIAKQQIAWFFPRLVNHQWSNSFFYQAIELKDQKETVFAHDQFLI